MSCLEPYWDLQIPELRIHIYEYIVERNKPNPDPMMLEECKATIQRIKAKRLVEAAERKPMAPALAAILRPVSPHLRITG